VGRPDMALYLFAKSFLEGPLIKLFNKGEHICDFTYIDDIAKPNPAWDSERPDRPLAARRSTSSK
jgi:nucleoside-diphosphate-sugar epimerase